MENPTSVSVKRGCIHVSCLGVLAHHSFVRDNVLHIMDKILTFQVTSCVLIILSCNAMPFVVVLLSYDHKILGIWN